MEWSLKLLQENPLLWICVMETVALGILWREHRRDGRTIIMLVREGNRANAATARALSKLSTLIGLRQRQ